MQEVADRGWSKGTPPEEPRRAAVSPTKAFLLLLGVVALVVVVAFVALREDESPAPADGREPDFSLTDAEALARWQELYGLVREAYEKRDLTLLPLIVTADSPMRTRMQRGIRRLIRHSVFDKTRFQTKQLVVTSNEINEVRVRQVVTVKPRVVDVNGRNLTIEPTTERQIVSWILRRQHSEWFFHDSVIVRATPVRER